MGHANIDNLIDELMKIPIKYKCQVCAKSKMKNFPHLVSENTATEPFRLIHMDLVQSPDYSIYGNRYFLTILDDYSRYGWVIFIDSKEKVFDAFATWYKKILNIFNKTIKYIKSDNGPEFINKLFKEYLDKNGIIHQDTVAYTPQQNGRVERLHGTLISWARAMLEDAKLSRRFWEDAVNTANYIRNRLPHKGINNKIPYEMLFKQKVNYNNFKVFGCQVFYYIPKQFRKKYDNTTSQGIFLGYHETNNTAYRIYDTDKNKVIISRTVEFFENVPGNINAPSSIPELIRFTNVEESENSVYNNNQNNLPNINNMNDINFNSNYNNNNLNNYYNNKMLNPYSINNLINNNNQNNTSKQMFQNGPIPFNYPYINIPINYQLPILNPSILNNNLNNNFNNNNNNENNYNIYNNEYNNKHLTEINERNNNNYFQDENYNNFQYENKYLNSNFNNLNSSNLNLNNKTNILKEDLNKQNNINIYTKDYDLNVSIENNKNKNNSNVSIENNKNKNNSNVSIENNINKNDSTNEENNTINENNKISKQNSSNLKENNQNLNNLNSQNLNILNNLKENKQRLNNLNIQNQIQNQNNINTKQEYYNINNKRKLNHFEKEDNTIKKIKSFNINDLIETNEINDKRKINNINEEKPNKRIKRYDINNILEFNKGNNYFTVSNINGIDIYALLTIDNQELKEPKDFKDIFNKVDKTEWLEAVENELYNMRKMKVYTPVEKIPNGANIITTRWIFTYKLDSNGNLMKRKARIVARGFTQREGIDFFKTFSPTLKQDSIRIFTAIATQYSYNIHQIDIKAAYLNAKLNEDIYMKLPEGEDNKNGKYKYCKLNKALYGLKQAGRAWNETLNNKLLKLNFQRLKSEPCLYIKNNYGKIACLVAVYVDDILITGTDTEIINTKNLLKENFEVTDVGKVNFIIGIKFEKLKNGYLIHQKRYLNEILEKFNINKYRECSNMMPIENELLRKKPFNPTKYRQAIGSLLYIAICTRPDILFSVNKASRKSVNPTYEDWYNVLKIFRYLKGNKNYGLKFIKENNTNNLNLKAYVDADLGGDKDTRRSTTGYVLTVNGTPTTWYSKLQHCVSTSTAESEYYGIHECAQQCLWYRNVFKELNLGNECITINSDNQAAIYNGENETINPKSKHIDLRYHSIREMIKNKQIKLQHIKSNENLADGFTKYLNTNLLNKFRESILSKF